jgi:hypothetical protein
MEGEMKRLLLALCAMAMLGWGVKADDPKPSQKFMPLEDIRPGMKGYGLTVFEGTKPERFEVEVLGLLVGVPNPRQSSVIARISGPQVNRTGVFAGMSGSPIYIDGKLVGALAFSYPFAKEPIAGITPIKYMIDNFESGHEDTPKGHPTVSFNTLIAASTGNGAEPQGRQGAESTAPGPQPSTQSLVPIATPVSFAGVPQAVLDLFSGDLTKLGIHAMTGIGGGSNLAPMASFNGDTLTPGASVSVELARGDFGIEASGTVTYRDGDRIYAFGHPFLGSGVTSWPMTESSVITVVPNLNNSFKLSVIGNLVGAVSQDRSTGVFGRLGEAPRMVPARVTVHTSRSKTEVYNFEVAADSFFTPLLMKIATFAAVSSTERQLGNQTIQLNGRISFNGQDDVLLDNTFSAPNGALFAAVASVERPLAILLNSGFDTRGLKGINIDIKSTDDRSGGSLSRLWVDKTEVRRGEHIELQAFARNENGSEFVQRIPLTIPADAPLGPLAILIGDGNSIAQAEMRQQGSEFSPKDLSQLIQAINKLKKNNRLYVKVMRASGGAVVNNEEMPTLPPSVLATLGSQRTSGGYTPLSIATITENVLPPSQFIITGQQSITINVVK